MTDHPTASGDTPTTIGNIEWEDRAAIHAADDGQGVFDGSKALRRGSFAEMIVHLMQFPAEVRDQYLIQKAGDRAYSAAEVEALARRDDFPAQ